jgi:integrase
MARECKELKDPEALIPGVCMKEPEQQHQGRSHQDVRGNMVKFSFQMQKDGLSSRSIETYTDSLHRLMKNGADLEDPENVKEVLMKLENSSTKAITKTAYSQFLKFLDLSWKPPKVHVEEKLPFIPLESEIDQLIAGCGKTTSLILQLLKESGMRIGEAVRLKWIDLNTENSTVVLNKPEKHCRSRIFRLSSKLMGMFQAYPKKSEKIFTSSAATREAIFRSQRFSLAEKLGNPRLRQITFHIIRHWKGTT